MNIKGELPRKTLTCINDERVGLYLKAYGLKESEILKGKTDSFDKRREPIEWLIPSDPDDLDRKSVV